VILNKLQINSDLAPLPVEVWTCKHAVLGGEELVDANLGLFIAWVDKDWNTVQVTEFLGTVLFLPDNFVPLMEWVAAAT
jgi:hypothetical protein